MRDVFSALRDQVFVVTSTFRDRLQGELDDIDHAQTGGSVPVFNLFLSSLIEASNFALSFLEQPKSDEPGDSDH